MMFSLLFASSILCLPSLIWYQNKSEHSDSYCILGDKKAHIVFLWFV